MEEIIISEERGGGERGGRGGGRGGERGGGGREGVGGGEREGEPKNINSLFSLFHEILKSSTVKQP